MVTCIAYDTALREGPEAVHCNQAHTYGVKRMDICTKYLVRCGHKRSTSGCPKKTFDTRD